MEPSHFTWSANALLTLPLKERQRHLPQPLQQSIEKLTATVHPLRIWIFGSRSRTDHQLLSDYDIATEIETRYRVEWSRFAVDEPEQIKMLLSVDWLLFNELSETMKSKILNEGLLLYEKTG